MTSKERMLRALAREKPDRLPVTVHQWQQYHLDTYLGGIDQFNVLTSGGQEEIRQETHRLFEGFGQDGGYICSASDHFFETSVDHLKAFAAAAAECLY